MIPEELAAVRSPSEKFKPILKATLEDPQIGRRGGGSSEARRRN